MQPGDLGLPVAAWRPGQEEMLYQLSLVEQPYILLEAPTGVGKSLIGLAYGRLIGNKTVVLVGTKQLQAQYVQSFAAASPPLVQAIGRGNFACNLDPTVTAEDARCVRGGRCEWRGTLHCDYYAQKLVAQDAQEAVLNYPYWLALANYARQFTQPDLLVCDEAHLLEDELRKFATVSFSKRDFRLLGQPFPDFTRVEAWVRWARLPFPVTPQGDEATEKARQRVKNHRELLASPLIDPDNWLLQDTGWGVKLLPVWVSPLAPKFLLAHAPKLLFMSATILDKALFCQQLGIPPEQAVLIRMDSAFPAERRPLYYQPVGKVKTSDAAVCARLIEAIDQIMSEHPGQRGIIHTVSYRLADAIMEHCRDKGRLLTHASAAARLSALDEFRATPGAVLVSPSLTTGVDLPYDLCEFQIITKLPFPDLGDRQIKKRMKLGPDGQPNTKGQGWYNWATLCTLIQTYGRGVRAADDYCATYLLDENWRWFRHTVKEMLPAWFTRAIKRRGNPATTTSIDQLLQEFDTPAA